MTKHYKSSTVVLIALYVILAFLAICMGKLDYANVLLLLGILFAIFCRGEE